MWNMSIYGRRRLAWPNSFSLIVLPNASARHSLIVRGKSCHRKLKLNLAFVMVLRITCGVLIDQKHALDTHRGQRFRLRLSPTYVTRLNLFATACKHLLDNNQLCFLFPAGLGPLQKFNCLQTDTSSCLSTTFVTSHSLSSPLFSSMDSSSSQPFPLSTLADVPIEYIIEQLRNLAPFYWEKPETADCTIIVPIPYVRRRPASTSESSKPPKFRHSVDFHPSATGGRVTESSLNNTPRLTFKLHMDYLSAHSSYLRALLSGACAMDLINSRPSSSSESAPHYSVPPERLPKLLSSINEHPVLYLPVPDPTSFHLIVHWMYFNEIDAITEALHDGSIQWEGIARNVEYLGLSADIKFFLTRWYNTWLDPSAAAEGEDFDSDSDTECSDSGDGDESTHTAVDVDEECIMKVDEKEPLRGRDRTSRSLFTLPLGSRTPSR